MNTSGPTKEDPLKAPTNTDSILTASFTGGELVNYF